MKIFQMHGACRGVREGVEAIELYRRAAALDYPNAMYALGYRYSIGDGVEQNEVQAIRWYSEAAVQVLALA